MDISIHNHAKKGSMVRIWKNSYQIKKETKEYIVFIKVTNKHDKKNNKKAIRGYGLKDITD